MKKYFEDKVDLMRKKKDEELEHYRKEIEKAHKMAIAKMVTHVGGGGSAEKGGMKKVMGAGHGGGHGEKKRIRVVK